LFDSDVGFYASLLTLLAPGILRIYSLMDPGLPEVWQMIFYLLFVSAFLRERYFASGVLIALAYLFRNNSIVLVPASLLWMFIYRRKALFGLPAVKMLGAAS